MRSPLAGLVLLDTSIFVHYARNDPTAQMIEEQYALTTRTERPLLSSIVEGEIRALALFNGWGKPRLDQLQQLFTELVRVDAGEPAIVAEYASLYVIARNSGVAMWQHQNDLWIAATARAAGADIFTCDGDFDWLRQQPDLPRVVCIEEQK